MQLLAALSFWTLGFLIFGTSLAFVGMPYERQLVRRIPRPRLPHLEYRLWLLLLSALEVAVIAVTGVGAAFLVIVYLVNRPSYLDFGIGKPPGTFEFVDAIAYFGVGLLIVVVPLGLFGYFFDRRIRADAPEPSASPAEVKALRIFFAASLASLLVLLSIVAVTIAMA